PAGDLPVSPCAVSRKALCPWPRLLLRVRAERLSIRLARGSVGQRPQQACAVAWRLRHCLAILECAQRAGAFAATIAGPPRRADGRAAVEERRGRSSRAALPRVGRVSE